MSSLNVNDILEELLDENRRILNELLFAHNYVIKSLEFKEFIDSNVKEFVDNLKPDVKKKYEELSRELNRLIDQKWANISDESPNESKIVTMTKSCEQPLCGQSSSSQSSNLNDCNEKNFWWPQRGKKILGQTQPLWSDYKLIASEYLQYMSNYRSFEH